MTLASIIEKVIAETTLTADLEGFYREPLWAILLRPIRAILRSPG